MRNLLSKGQVGITFASILAGISLVGGVTSSFFYSKLASSDRTANVERDIAVLQKEDENVTFRINELKEDMNKRFDKLEVLIQKR